MTDEMLDLARTNAAQAGTTNVEFLKGTIEDIPLPDAIGRRGDQQLRDQPVGRQTEGDHRDVPGAQPRWPDRHQRCGGRGPPQYRGAGRTRVLRQAASPAPCLDRNTSTASPPPASPTRPSVSPTRPRTACTAPSSKPPSRTGQPDRPQLTTDFDVLVVGGDQAGLAAGIVDAGDQRPCLATTTA